MKVDQTEASGSLFSRGNKNRIFWNLFSGCFVFIFRMHFPDAFSGCVGGDPRGGGYGGPKRLGRQTGSVAVPTIAEGHSGALFWGRSKIGFVGVARNY